MRRCVCVCDYCSVLKLTVMNEGYYIEVSLKTLLSLLTLL